MPDFEIALAHDDATLEKLKKMKVKHISFYAEGSQNNGTHELQQDNTYKFILYRR